MSTDAECAKLGKHFKNCKTASFSLIVYWWGNIFIKLSKNMQQLLCSTSSILSTDLQKGSDIEIKKPWAQGILKYANHFKNDTLQYRIYKKANNCFHIQTNLRQLSRQMIKSVKANANCIWSKKTLQPNKDVDWSLKQRAPPSHTLKAEGIKALILSEITQGTYVVLLYRHIYIEIYLTNYCRSMNKNKKHGW